MINQSKSCDEKGTLFYQTHSPYARKVLVLMHELNIAHQYDVIHHETSPMLDNNDVFEQNPLGKVPVLISDEDVIFDSKVIGHYLLAGKHSTSVIHDLKSQQLEALADSLMDVGIICRWEMERRPTQYRYKDFYVGHLKKIHRSLDWLTTQSFTDDVSIGHIACACAMEWLVFRELIQIEKFPIIANWLHAFSQRESMQKTQYTGYTDDGFKVEGLIEQARQSHW